MNNEIVVPPYVVELQNNQCQVTLAGDLTAATIPDLQPALRKALNQGASEMVFDLSNAVMLDSSGIGLLIATANSVTRRGGKVRVTNVSDDIFRLLQMMRLVDRLNATSRPGQEGHRG
jgi:anti-anti-sigma factor